MTKYGIFTFPTEYSIRADQLARAVEERGFESLWLPEHTHIPVQRRSPYPGGGLLPQDYFHIADPFVGLAAAAAVTRKIKLGTAVCLVIEHDPIVLAKKTASLDLLSGGRFIFGIGIGWNAEEMENHGTVFKTRHRLLRERIEAIKTIWCEDEPEYHGRFVNFGPIRSFPKPVQKPHPRIFFGGDTPLARQRVVDNYDGWLPTIMRTEDFLAGIQHIRTLAHERGRNPRSIEISMVWPRPDRRILDRYEAAGVDRVILGLPSVSADEVLRKLDECADLAGLEPPGSD
jgi:probable F420-dependent oxidoreductase